MKKISLIFTFVFCISTIVLGQSNNGIKLKAWIEIEGKLHNLLVAARLQNQGKPISSIDYVLKTKKEGRIGNSSTVQKGKCIIQNKNILSLSEARVNLTQSDRLIVNLLIYKNDTLIAQDSVVFQGERDSKL